MTSAQKHPAVAGFEETGVQEDATAFKALYHKLFQ